MGKNKRGKKIALREKMKKSENAKPEVKVNPFELRINHERYNILGRKSKNDKGMPGVSHNKAIKKRKEFFFKNKLLMSKSNRFIDKRIGEYDKSILKEDQIAARMVYERRKKLKRNIYNLNDDEELTHLGKPISLLETIDNPVSDSDDEDKLDANFVEEAHFGGFLMKKTSDEPPKTHKEIIGDLILESKRRKEEKKLEREKNMDLTEQLDKEFKKVMSEIGSLKQEKQPSAPKKDQYDMIVQELKFEPRGAPANKLKTPEEIAKEEKEKLEKLEQERLLRMKDSTDDKPVFDQLSADSIYDGLELDDDFSIPAADDEAGSATQGTQNEGDDKSLENSDKSDSESSENDDDEEEEAVYSDLDSGSENEKEEESENEEEEESENEVEMKDESKSATVTSTRTVPHKIACAGTLEELLELVSAYNDEVSVIVEKMMKCNHPSLSDGNRKKMETLFKILLDYISHICQEGEYTNVVNSLVPHLYSLAEISPLNCAVVFRDALLAAFEVMKKQRKGAHKNNFPHIGSLITLKLCGILYSTSDFKHPVVIVAMLFMSEVLSQKFLITYENLISRLFITNLFYEYVALSKRFVPEAINFLQTVIFLASVKGLESSKFCKSICHGDKNLLLVTSVEECEPQKINVSMLSNVPIENNDKLKLSVLNSAVKQLQYYIGIYSSLPSFPELFSPIRYLLKNLPVEFYPSSLKLSITRLSDEIADVLSQSRTYVVFPLKRPKPLKLFEPAYDMSFGGKKNNPAKKMKIVRDLTKKCKREEKGVIREVRRDAQFLAQQLLQEKIEKDEERKNKVKKLFQELNAQQGELKSLSRKK